MLEDLLFATDLFERKAEIIALVPELQPLDGMFQGGHHEFDALEHTVRVVEAVPNDVGLRLAALLHDVGKPATRAPHPKKPGVFQFIGHAEAGVEIARTVCARLGVAPEVTERVCGLVGMHMDPIMLVSNGCSDKGVRNLVRKAGERKVSLTDLMSLAYADLRGTGKGRKPLEELDPLYDKLLAL